MLHAVWTIRAVRRAALAAALLLAPAAAQAAAQAQKPPIHGLITMGRLNFLDDPAILPDNSMREPLTHTGVYAGAVINVEWAQIEAAPGRYDFSVIDQGLASLRAYNGQNAQARMVAKLRVFAGPVAPDWAKRLAGGPIAITIRNHPATIGPAWSSAYRRAWRALQQALAARYDADPLVREVAIASCATMTDEPFVIPLNRDNLPGMTQAGYSDSAMQACLLGALDDYAPWTQVALDFPFNAWRDSDGGHVRRNPDFTLKVMDQARQRLGPRLVISNHGIGPRIGPVDGPIVAEIRRLGPPMAFQSVRPTEDWPATIETARQLGVTEMELWVTRDAGGIAAIDQDELRQWRSELAR
jgi:hypothetical protein